MSIEVQTFSGRTYSLGCLPRTVSTCGDGMFPVFGETDGTPPLLTWDEINARDTDLSAFFRWHTINQSAQASCCGAGGAQIIMGLRKILGLDDVVIAQSSLYGPGNGGRDAGMAIDTCLRILTNQGALPASYIDQYDWRGFWRGTWPDGWETEAEKYQALEAWDCPTLRHMMSAVESGWPVLYGCKGHAVVRIARDKDKNSWGADWGGHGNGIGQWATDREIERGISSYGAWALRVVTDPTNDGDV